MKMALANIPKQQVKDRVVNIQADSKLSWDEQDHRDNTHVQESVILLMHLISAREIDVETNILEIAIDR